jgi:hypothetical protein
MVFSYFCSCKTAFDAEPEKTKTRQRRKIDFFYYVFISTEVNLNSRYSYDVIFSDGAISNCTSVISLQII